MEWPEGEKEPTQYWLSTLPEMIAVSELVDTAKLRWRIERDNQELKQELGLGHYEGRGWRGFHHHATLCIAAYGFLVQERAALPPQYLAAPCLSGLVRSPRPPCHGDPPLRPERHVSTSIATLRITLARALVRSLQRCPCCHQPNTQLMTQ